MSRTAYIVEYLIALIFGVLIGLIVMTCLPAYGQRGIGTRALLVFPPPNIVPVITLAWTPNPLALDTVIVSSTNLLTPPPWSVRAVVFNTVTNTVSLPRTNRMEFFRAYSE